MKPHSSLDISNFYLAQTGKFSLFDKTSEVEAFKKFEIDAARIMAALESVPETRILIRDEPRKISLKNHEEVLRRLGYEDPTRKDREVTARVQNFLHEIINLDAAIDDAPDEDARTFALKEKYFRFTDTAIGKSFLDEALQHPLASAARRNRERMEFQRNKIVEANLRLITHVSKRYAYSRLSQLDLIQEGSIGLMRSIERFDWRMGFKFSTYAIWWIRQSITRGIAEKENDVKIPHHQRDLIRKVKRETRAFEAQHGRKPLAFEIESTRDLSDEKINLLRDASRPIVQLDAKPLDSDLDSPINYMTDEKTLSPEASLFHKNIAEKLEQALCCLTPKEKEIVTLRFGLREDNPMTLDEIGARIRVSRERIRQIEKAALTKMSKAPGAHELRIQLIDY